MIVALDIRRASDFGAGTYTRNLVEALARLDSTTSYFLVGRDSDAAALGHLPDNFQLLVFDRSPDGLRHNLRLAWQLHRRKVDVWHTPYLATCWMVACPHIITVHDTAPFSPLAPDGAALSDLLRFYRTRHCLRRAHRILSVSHATRRDLIRQFGLTANKIDVVYNAVDAQLDPHPAPDEVEHTLSRYSAHDPYLLYAGNVSPRKNLPRLIEAFALVKHELRDHPDYRNLKLIIIGDELSQNPQLRRAVVKSRAQNHVRFLGFVPPQTLSVFYSRAAAFAFPSLYEGFGLPPLEAMAHGAPVLASNVSALPEVLGEAALYVNPENVFDISRGIRSLLLDKKLRKQLVKRGHAQVAKFSWKESVQRVLEVYRAAAGAEAS